MKLGERLKTLRKEKNLTQEQLAKIIHVGKVSVCCYEKEVRTPSIDTLIDLANIFNVSLDYLVGRTDKR